MIKRLYFDVETSGLSATENAILQLAAIMEVDGNIVDEINLFIKPFKTDTLTDKAFSIHGLDPTEERFIPPQKAYKMFVDFLDTHINKYDKLDKAYMVGFNAHGFDAPFLNQWFIKNGSPYMYSYFFGETLDCFILLGYACQGQREKLGDFKLTTVAESLGIKIKGTAHDALYDTWLTYEIFQIMLKEYPL